LLEAQDELKWQEEMFDFAREKRRNKLRAVRDVIAGLDKFIEDLAVKTPEKDFPSLKNAKERKKALERQVEVLEEEEGKLFINRRDAIREIRIRIVRAEVALRRLEARHARQREEIAVQREKMQSQLQRFEDKALNLEPASRLRDVERKLDALRREVGELRRALERQKQSLPR